MTRYAISWKRSYDEGYIEYRGDMRGAMDMMRGMLAIEGTAITDIRIEEEGLGE